MTLNYANEQKLCKLFETRTSYCVGLNLVLGNVLTTIKVCKKWLLIQEGQKGVLSSSMKTTQTISLPMWRFLCSYKNINEYIDYIIPIIKIISYSPKIIKYSFSKLTFWWSFGSFGRCVETWNMISIPRQRVKIEYSPVRSCTVSSPPLYRSNPGLRNAFRNQKFKYLCMSSNLYIM